MAYQIRAKEALVNMDTTLEDAVLDFVVPACCSEYCEVEPDGYCEHGYPSVLVKLGLI